MLLDSVSSWIASNASDFEVVLTTHTWDGLVHSTNFPTDIVLLEFHSTESLSIEARLRTCRAAGAKVIVLGSFDSRAAKDQSLAAGASAFVPKTQSMRELIEVARVVMGMASNDCLQTQWRPLPIGAVNHEKPLLSRGETEAFKLYVTGLSTTQVASQMNVQYETAKTFLRRVREKYAKANRPASKKADLIRRAAEDGYLQ